MYAVMTFAVSDKCRLSGNVKCARTFDSSEVAYVTDFPLQIISRICNSVFVLFLSFVKVENKFSVNYSL